MFNKARIKLTTWYLIIIFLITGLFSIAFYKVSTREFHKVARRVELTKNFLDENHNLPPPPPGLPSFEELQEVEQRLLTNLVYINGVILLLSGAAAYFLAGKTLKPIKLMIDEQNQFISNSSHELRTPLATIRAEMEASLLEKNINDARARKLIKSNLEEIDKLQKLSGNLLNLAKLHNNHSNSEKYRLIDFSRLVEIAFGDVNALAKKNQIKINLKRFKDVLVLGNENELRELIVILLDNAVKYSSKNSEVKVWARTNKDRVELMIKDQGVGIAKNDLDHIFERFYRSNKHRSNIEGFGLGLSIAKQIVLKHGGKISAESQLGKGSTFIVSFPIAKS